MGRILILWTFLVVGCAQQQSDPAWNDMWTDKRLRQTFYAHTGCGECAQRRLAGFSKENDSPERINLPMQPAGLPRVPLAPVETDKSDIEKKMDELSRHVQKLDDAVKTNAQTTNANESILATEIQGIAPKAKGGQ